LDTNFYHITPKPAQPLMIKHLWQEKL